MDKLKTQRRKRFGIQALWTLVTNANFTGFLDGKLYKGPLKQFCVPGLNCYSCPGALGSCPIGAMQALAGSPDYALSLLVLGFLVSVTFYRCPHCHRVLPANRGKMDDCPYCKLPLRDTK